MQCHNFNKDWTFEKADQADRLKAFYGNSNAVAVTLPHDAMIREKRDKDCPSGAQSGFYPGGVYTYEKKFMAQYEWKKQDVFLEFEGIYGIAFSAVIPLYFTKPSAANGAAPKMHTHDTVSVPTYGLSKKYSPTATPQARTEKMNCLSDSPKNIDSV